MNSNQSRVVLAPGSRSLGSNPETAESARTIRYTMGPCSLGRVLVAQTERGICATLIGDDDAALVSDLARRFAGFSIMPDDGAMVSALGAVIQCIEAPSADRGLTLDLVGTSFQRRVWRALRGIPAGETASYRDIATQVGQPAAVRAVAQACAQNPLAVIVPCHRVVRADGSLSGYRWGIERKRTLLAREAVI